MQPESRNTGVVQSHDMTSHSEVGRLHAQPRSTHMASVTEFDAPRDDDAQSPTPPNSEVASVVALANAVFAGLAGLFMATRSIALTVLAAGLVALLGLSIVFRRRHRG